jgi:hypothetical protein
MKTLTLEIKDKTVADKILWMLQHFKGDGLVIKEIEDSSCDAQTKASIQQSVYELNMVKSGNLTARPVKELLDAL